MAICYIDLKDLNDAESALKNSIAISKEVKDSIVLVMAINRLADVQIKKGNFNEDIKFFNLALKENQDRSIWEKCFAYTNLGEAYYLKGDFGLAIQFGIKARELAESMNANWDKQQALSLLNRSYSKMWDYRQAYYHLEQYKLISDSVYSTIKDQEINRLLLQQKQQENEELKNTIQIKKQKSQLNKLVNALIVLSVLSLIIITLIIHKKRKETAKLNAELANLNHSKDQLFSVVAHDLRSPIMSIV